MNLTIGFSPCPNDTFIFDAMVNGKIDTGAYRFDVVMKDVEQLNKWAFEGQLDITKLSYHAYLYLQEKYQLLETGSALGRNCGPLLIALKDKGIGTIDNCRIAIPGEYTTAHFLLRYAYPNATIKKNYLFSDIERALKNDEVDLGVIIHENRFTYAERGFKKIIDLGEYWEEKTKMPIPLGGIVIKTSLGEKVQKDIDQIIFKSLSYAYEHPSDINAFIFDNAQEMSPEVVKKHIDLYVNSYSKGLGKEGHKAILRMKEEAHKMKII